MPRFRALLSLRFALALLIPMVAVAGVQGFHEFRRASAAVRDDAARLGEVILDANLERITAALTAPTTPPARSVLSANQRSELAVQSLQFVDRNGNVQRTLEFSGMECLAQPPDGADAAPTARDHEHVVVARTLRAPSGRRSGEIRMTVCLTDGVALARSQHFRFLMVLLTLLAAAVPAIVWIQRWYVTFMSSLVTAMDRISRGQGTTRARKDLGPLGSAFDRMTQRMASQAQEVLNMRDTAIKAAESARRANDAKSRFLAHMSHEIRTPMTAILGYTELIMDPTASSDERLQHAATIRRNGEYLLSIVNDILDVSKVEAGHMVVEDRVCSPFEVVRGVVALLRDRARQKGLLLTSEFPDPLPDRIRTDPVRLQQILVNLVGNALKFTEHGSVRIVTRPCTGANGKPQLKFQIIDTGIGMSPEAVERLFKPFTQADAATTRNYGGTGLGLTISKQLAELLGGSIGVHSERGRGSTFTVVVRAGAVEASRQRTESPARSERAFAALQPADGEYPRYRGHVLLAEDSPDVRGLVSRLLVKTGLELDVVEDGAQALETGLASIERGHTYDLILMDMHMPKMNGDRVVEELRARGYRGKIVAITAHATGEALDRIIDAGCDGHFLKPFQREKLLALLGDFLEPAGDGNEATPVSASARAGSVTDEPPPPDAAATEGEHAVLEPLVSTYADDPEMLEFIVEFQRVLPHTVATVEAALEEGDPEALARVIHQVKGAAGTVGYQVISDQARLVEEAMGQSPPDATLAPLCADLLHLCQRAMARVGA